MNCRPNDLAVVVRSAAGNEGRIVQCLELAFMPCLPSRIHRGGMAWVWKLDRQLPAIGGGLEPYAMDSQLRPIRDSDGTDEMLQLVGKPEGITA